MKNKKKLTAAIIGAVIAYIQMEKQPPPATSRVKPKIKANRWKISRKRE